MSASKRTRDAASSVLAAINRLRSAAEYARSVDMKADVEPFLVRAHELRDELGKLAGRLAVAEHRRRQQGRFA